jgi:hypothetical protein
MIPGIGIEEGCIILRFHFEKKVVAILNLGGHAPNLGRLLKEKCNASRKKRA